MNALRTRHLMHLLSRGCRSLRRPREGSLAIRGLAAALLVIAAFADDTAAAGMMSATRNDESSIQSRPAAHAPAALRVSDELPSARGAQPGLDLRFIADARASIEALRRSSTAAVSAERFVAATVDERVYDATAPPRC